MGWWGVSQNAAGDAFVKAMREEMAKMRAILEEMQAARAATAELSAINAGAVAREGVEVVAGGLHADL